MRTVYRFVALGAVALFLPGCFVTPSMQPVRASLIVRHGLMLFLPKDPLAPRVLTLSKRNELERDLATIAQQFTSQAEFNETFAKAAGITQLAATNVHFEVSNDNERSKDNGPVLGATELRALYESSFNHYVGGLSDFHSLGDYLHAIATYHRHVITLIQMMSNDAAGDLLFRGGDIAETTEKADRRYHELLTFTLGRHMFRQLFACSAETSSCKTAEVAYALMATHFAYPEALATDSELLLATLDPASQEQAAKSPATKETIDQAEKFVAGLVKKLTEGL